MKQILHTQQRTMKSLLSIQHYFIFFLILFFSISFQTLKAQTGQALNFDGVDDYVDITGVPISGSYTKEAWINLPVVDPLDPNAHNIISGATTSLYVYQGKLGAGHNFNNVQDPTVLSPNTWYHVAVTYDAATTTMTLYKNGVQVATNPFVTTATESVLYLGAIYTGTIGYFFNGTMDNVRIWNVARSSSEILNDYSCFIAPNSPNLEALYPFTQGIANGNNPGVTTLGDSTSNAHNGTLNNFALTGSTSNWVAPGAPLTNNCTALPVQLSDFSIMKSGNGVQLKWETATEINNKGFQIQRSSDGLNNWKDVAFVGGSGNTNERHKYAYADLSPVKGNNYYRLMQINFDGQATYSSIRSIRIIQVSQLVLYPTLATNNITLEVASTDMLNTIFSIYDGQGRKVQQEKLVDQKQQINISNLQRGMYLIKLQNGASERFVKQ
ncbi:MAG: LamG-like jellyroll fold domain-containing protein [Ginsengibacter sp.]